jgi:hypothetical protein
LFASTGIKSLAYDPQKTIIHHHVGCIFHLAYLTLALFVFNLDFFSSTSGLVGTFSSAEGHLKGLVVKPSERVGATLQNHLTFSDIPCNVIATDSQSVRLEMPQLFKWS